MKKKTLLLLFLTMTGSVIAINITTLDGTVYNNAEVITVTPAGLDIMFTNSKGLPALKGIDFNNLPENISKQYMKDPSQSADYQREVSRLTPANLKDVISSRQNEIIRDKQQHKSTATPKSQKQLEHAIFAHRLGGEFRVINSINVGSIVLPANITAGEKPTVKSGLIFICGLNENPDFLCQGFIYPTGIKVNTAECIGLPVYATTAESAAAILDFYINLQTDYQLDKEKIKQQQKSENTLANDNVATTRSVAEQLLFNYDATFYISQCYPEWYIDYCRRSRTPSTTAKPPPKPPLRVVDPRKPVITPDSFSSRYRDPFHPYGCPGAYTGFFKKPCP